jgi:Tn3 transposase DDE domain
MVLRPSDLAEHARQDEQEMTVLCLRILQAALVYVNTLMLQDVLAEDNWAELLTPEDRRGLTPLFWQHVLRHGEAKLDMTARLGIRTTAPRTPCANSDSAPVSGPACDTNRAPTAWRCYLVL